MVLVYLNIPDSDINALSPVVVLENRNKNTNDFLVYLRVLSAF
jgi:hypothetical protein